MTGTPALFAVIRVPIEAPMTDTIARAYIYSRMSPTGLKVDSIAIESPDGPQSDEEPLYCDRDEC